MSRRVGPTSWRRDWWEVGAPASGGLLGMGLRDSQLVEHTLHLLVDAEGCALLLIPIGLAGPVTLRQGGVLLDGSLALPLPPPHGWDLNGRQVQRLQRRGRVHEEKGRRAVGREGGEAGTSRRVERAEREDTVTMTGTEYWSYQGTGRQTQMGRGCRLRGKTGRNTENKALRGGEQWPAATTT